MARKGRDFIPLVACAVIGAVACDDGGAGSASRAIYRASFPPSVLNSAGFHNSRRETGWEGIEKQEGDEGASSFLIPPIELDAEGRHDGTVIWLHRQGSSGDEASRKLGKLRLECPHLRFVLPTAPSRPLTPSSSLCMSTWLYHSPAFLAEVKRGPGQIGIPPIPDSEDGEEGGGEGGKRGDGTGRRRGGGGDEEERGREDGRQGVMKGEEEEEGEQKRGEEQEGDREGEGIEGWKEGEVDVLTGAEAPMSYRTRMKLPTGERRDSKDEGVGERKGKGIAERRGDATRELRSRLISSIEYIEGLVYAECARGIDPLNVVIVAEGQSACVAASAASRLPFRLGGLIIMGSHVPVLLGLSPQISCRYVPALHMHGVRDTVVLLDEARETLQLLETMGFDAEWKEVDANHQVMPEATSCVSRFLTTALSLEQKHHQSGFRKATPLSGPY